MTGRTEGRQAHRHGDAPAVRCPQCGSLSVARILYGEPAADWKLDTEIRNGEVVLGGCVVGAEDPTYRCGQCGTAFRDATPGAAVGGPTRESLATKLLPAEPRPGSWHVGRLVLTGAASRSEKGPPDRRALLGAALDELVRQQVHVRYLITSAGFFKPKPPAGVELTHGWGTEQGDFDRVRDIAAVSVTGLLSDALDRAQGHVDYLVVGADVHGLGHHAYGETALVYDVRTRTLVRSTGKSYPTTEQERKLVRNPNAAGHVLDVGGEQVAVLVCHDLNAWSPRGTASRGWTRDEKAAELDRALRKGRPTTVLHLPHTTHSAQTWAQAWAKIEALLPGVIWASAIRYRKGDSRPQMPLGPKLLDRTRSGSGQVLDIVLGDHTSL